MKAKLSKLPGVSTSDCDCSRSKGTNILQLERQIGGLQKTVSHHTTISKLYLAAHKHCKDTCLALDAKLNMLKSDDLATNDGQPYNEEVQTPVMELVGEKEVSSKNCYGVIQAELVGEKEVSSKNCCGVIQAVAHWMFGKNIPTCDMPCPNTAVNLMDKAQVLSKFHVAESIMNASAWNLHSDGTSKDHKKISVYTGAEEETNNLPRSRVLCCDAVNVSTPAEIPSMIMCMQTITLHLSTWPKIFCRNTRVSGTNRSRYFINGLA